MPNGFDFTIIIHSHTHAYIHTYFGRLYNFNMGWRQLFAVAAFGFAGNYSVAHFVCQGIHIYSDFLFIQVFVFYGMQTKMRGTYRDDTNTSSKMPRAEILVITLFVCIPSESENNVRLLQICRCRFHYEFRSFNKIYSSIWILESLGQIPNKMNSINIYILNKNRNKQHQNTEYRTVKCVCVFVCIWTEMNYAWKKPQLRKKRFRSKFMVCMCVCVALHLFSFLISLYYYT